MIVKEGCIVEVSYNLFLGADDEAVEFFDEEEPLEFLIGAGEMLPDFENKLLGKKAGEKFDISIDEKNAFGEYDESLLVKMDISLFDNDPVEEGEIITLDSEDGSSYDAMVLEISEDYILVDMNHPFAGEDLKYKGIILSIRIEN